MLGWLLFVLNTLGAREHVTVSPQLAQDIVDAAVAHPMPGPFGEARMAATLGAMAWHESRFNVNAMGDCTDPTTGKRIDRVDDPRRTRATCKSFGPLQSPPSVTVRHIAAYLTRHTVAEYACGGRAPSPTCTAIQRSRHALAVRLVYASPTRPLDLEAR